MVRRGFDDNWTHGTAALRDCWQRLTDEDIASIAGERDQLMQRIKARYEKTYGEIEREVTEFELRELRAGYAARPSLGIMND